MGGRRLAVGLVGVTVAAATAGWLAGSRIRSPAEIAAHTDPPEASLITVPAERTALSTDVVVRGTVRHGTPQPVVLAASALKGSELIVTVPPEKGATLAEGALVMTLSGRPVFVLAGNDPAHRDLEVGSRGPDVAQLQAALARLGHDPGRRDGVFDAATAAATAGLYRSAGFQPFGLTAEQTQLLRAAQEAAAAAGERRLDAQRVLDEARTPVALDVVGAAADVAAYQDAAVAADAGVADARAAREAAEDAVATAEANLVAAQAEQRRADLDSAAALAEKAALLEVALAGEQAAALRLAEGEAIDPATGEPQASPAQLAALRAELSAATATVTSSRLAVDAARSGGEAARAAAAAAVSGAVAELAQARRVLALAEGAVPRAAETQAAARDRARRAEARLAALEHPPPRPVLEEALALARGEEARTAAELDRLASTWSFQVPADELVFLPALPARVDEVKAQRGQVLAGEAMTVSGFHLAVDSALSLSDAKLVRGDMAATIEEPDLGITVGGRVTEVGDRPGTHGTDPQHVYLQVTPDEAPAQLIGASVKLTIAVRSTAGEVLAVPASALFATALGTSQLQVLDGQTARFVTVRPGLAARGLVEVNALDGALRPGDRVVVGERPGQATAAPTPTTGTAGRGG